MPELPQWTAPSAKGANATRFARVPQKTEKALLLADFEHLFLDIPLEGKPQDLREAAIPRECSVPRCGDPASEGQNALRDQMRKLTK